MPARIPSNIFRSARCLSFALAVAAGSVGSAGAVTATPTKGTERCTVLAKQIDAASKARKVALTWSVKRLAGEGKALCADGKTAQGARSYVKALNLLGVSPVLNP